MGLAILDWRLAIGVDRKLLLAGTIPKLSEAGKNRKSQI